MITLTNEGQTMTEAEPVKIFVRKGHGPEQRTLSFGLLPDMDQVRLLEMDYAMDGNRAIRYLNMDNESLVDAQLELVDYLKESGFNVLFV